MTIEEGKILDGVVANIASFGAFIQLPGGKTGLVHISEVADTYVKDIRNYLKEKDKVRVKVLSVDANGKINLSIKQAPAIKKPVRPAEIDWGQEAKKAQSGNFEDLMSKFLKDSDEKISQLKKSSDTRKGGGGYRRGNGYSGGGNNID